MAVLVCYIQVTSQTITSYDCSPRATIVATMDFETPVCDLSINATDTLMECFTIVWMFSQSTVYDNFCSCECTC